MTFQHLIFFPLKAVLPEIEKELEEPGAGNLPKTVVLSDFHGDIDRLTELLSDAFTKLFGKTIKITYGNPVAYQLKLHGISFNKLNGTPSKANTKIFLFIL